MRSETRATRRRVLVSLGAGAATALAGCNTTDEVTYEEGEVGNASGDERSADEMVAAQAVAQTEANADVRPLDALSVADHEFTVQDGYAGPTVRGTVENTGGRVEFAEVRVRVYDDAGDHIGRYLDSTGDLDGGSTWGFEAVLLVSPSDVASYDVAVLGIPT